MANNPINAIDINGDSITITRRRGFLGFGGKETLTYKDGGLYNADGSEYTGKVNGFLSKVVNALENLNNTKEGNLVVTELQDSENVFDIQKGTKNSFTPNSVRKASNNLRDTESSTGSGGIIRWNPNSTIGGLNIQGSTIRPAYIGLGHELIHGSDANRGILNYTKQEGVSIADWNAVYRENIIRSQANIPARQYYGYDMTTGSPVGIGPNLFKNFLKRQLKEKYYSF